ncbi:hypothetical protein HK099_005922 [Clydaea vesicula]|uniref:Uncharacterized protein n=1 Tax=Clydaea vesicula TaxID=447962 RepID=A0AAD5TYV1_9FUNG|nr:hypothetical protein HK099_005922 [Clydaea vesicula]
MGDPIQITLAIILVVVLICYYWYDRRSRGDEIDVWGGNGNITSNRPRRVSTASNLNHNQYSYPPPTKKHSVHHSNFSSEYNSPETAPYNRNSTTINIPDPPPPTYQPKTN